jgi:RNA polymerase sigma-B factor
MTTVEGSERSRFEELSRSRDPRLRAELIEEHLELARRLAGRFVRRNESFDDLFQVASVGLVKAVDGFRPELGYQFGAYAVTTILGELKRHFRDQGWSVRAPRRLQELYLQLSPTTEELSQELGRAPTVDELSDRLQVSNEDVLEAMEAGQAYRTASLDATVEDSDKPTINIGSEDPRFELADDLLSVSDAMLRLPERERHILKLRFFDDMTQAEIARAVGLSQMQISRLLDQSLSALREDAAAVGIPALAAS